MTMMQFGAIATLGCALISGCAAFDAGIAQGKGEEAEAAVMRLDAIKHQMWLREISLRGKNPKARALAIGRLDSSGENIENLCSIVMSRNTKEPAELRVAAFERLVALGKAEELLSRHGNLAELVAFGEKGNSMSFAEEWRIKAMEHVAQCRPEFLLDPNVPVSIRKSAVDKISRSGSNYADVYVRLLNAASDESNAGHGDCKVLISCLPYDNETVKVFSRADVSFAARQLLFSMLKDEKLQYEALDKILWNAKGDAEDGIDNRLFKWAVANTRNAKMLGKLVNSTIEALYISEEEKAKKLVEVVNCIDDDDVLIDILNNNNPTIRRESKLSPLAMAALSRIKNQTKRKALEPRIMAYNAPDVKTRVDALSDVYVTDPQEAYKIVTEWFSSENRKGNMKGAEITGGIRDLKTLVGLMAICRKDLDSREWKTEIDSVNQILEGIKDGILNTMSENVDGLSNEEKDKLIAGAIVRAEEMVKAGKTCVVGNYYVGMPVVDFIALSKLRDIKASLHNFDVTTANDEPVVKCFSLDSKNVYKATGVEKSECAYKLPRVLGIAMFKANVTKIKRNNSVSTQISEYSGDYSSSFTGGDLYLESENQDKGIAVTLWDKSGNLVFRALEQ